MLSNCLLVGAGGCIGAVLRYLAGLIRISETAIFPYRTFAVNLLGCLAIGIIAALVEKNTMADPKLILFLKVGICGGFTTFSTFGLETVDLINTGHPGIAFLYVVLSVLLGTALIFGAQYVIGR